MRQAGAEKLETIRLVENSELSVTVTLRELGVPRSTFYGWYRRYRDRGVVGLADRHSGAAFTGTGYRTGCVSKWSTRPWPHPEASPRELVWQITDTADYFISESSVYRILKRT